MTIDNYWNTIDAHSAILGRAAERPSKNYLSTNTGLRLFRALQGHARKLYRRYPGDPVGFLSELHSSSYWPRRRHHSLTPEDYETLLGLAEQVAGEYAGACDVLKGTNG